MKTHTVLFLCSGNYYRSRFAEEWFNWLASREAIPWMAISRGLNRQSRNPGPLSPHTVEALSALGVPLAEPLRFPQLATQADFENSELCIAVKELEHRPLIRELFPAWEEKVEYWSIHDVDCSQPAVALPELRARVEGLLARLRSGVNTDPVSNQLTDGSGNGHA